MRQQDKMAALESVNEALKDSRKMLQQTVADLVNEAVEQRAYNTHLCGRVAEARVIIGELQTEIVRLQRIETRLQEKVA